MPLYPSILPTQFPEDPEKCEMKMEVFKRLDEYAEKHQLQGPLQVIRIAQRSAAALSREYDLTSLIYDLALNSLLSSSGSPEQALPRFLSEISKMKDPFVLTKFREAALKEIPPFNPCVELLPKRLRKATPPSTKGIENYRERIRTERVRAGGSFRKLRLLQFFEEVLGRDEISVDGRISTVKQGLSSLSSLRDEDLTAVWDCFDKRFPLRKLLMALPPHDTVQILDAYFLSYEKLLEDEGRSEEACLRSYFREMLNSATLSNQEACTMHLACMIHDTGDSVLARRNRDFSEAIALTLSLMKDAPNRRSRAEIGLLSLGFLSRLSEETGYGGLAPLLDAFKEKGEGIQDREARGAFVQQELKAILNDFKCDGGKGFKSAVRKGRPKTLVTGEGEIKVGETVLPVNDRN